MKYTRDNQKEMPTIFHHRTPFFYMKNHYISEVPEHFQSFSSSWNHLT